MNASGDGKLYNYGKEIYQLADEIFPICRSLTGNGVRETFEIFKKHYSDITMYEVPTGTEAFDWTVPKEWNIRDAYIADESGKKVIDFHENNLHVLGYSTPLDEWMETEKLKEHIHTFKEQPDVIPYMTSYYKERYGFCMTEKQKESLVEDKYHAVIDSTLEDGSLTYGEIIIPGESEKEIFISSYVCHPSMANNECSGPSVAIYLAKWLAEKPHRKYTYRIVLAPETIGAITYISRNLDALKQNVIAGFNLSCVGDNRTYSLVESRYGNTLADRVMENVLCYHYKEFIKYSYLKRGSDERQYCAPGVDLPLVGFCRSKYHVYPEYHTSADNMSVISPEGLGGSFEAMAKCINALEHNEKYKLTCLCEPQLGKRGQVPTISSKETFRQTLVLKDVVAYADGTNDLIELSNLIKAPVDDIIPIVERLLEAGLLEIAER